MEILAPSASDKDEARRTLFKEVQAVLIEHDSAKSAKRSFDAASCEERECV